MGSKIPYDDKMEYSVKLGFDVARVHSDDSLMGKYALCFAAAIIRYEIMNACRILGIDTKRMMNQNQSKRKGGDALQKDDSDAIKPKRKPVRPKGSKNKKTLEREANAIDIPKRKPGRPKGSKNKKTLEREAMLQKRRPGRPKGSMNKPEQPPE